MDKAIKEYEERLKTRERHDEENMEDSDDNRHNDEDVKDKSKEETLNRKESEAEEKADNGMKD